MPRRDCLRAFQRVCSCIRSAGSQLAVLKEEMNELSNHFGHVGLKARWPGWGCGLTAPCLTLLGSYFVAAGLYAENTEYKAGGLEIKVTPCCSHSRLDHVRPNGQADN